VAKYEQLAMTLRTQIRSGQLKPGERLPSITDLIDTYRVSYGSVRGAMLVLKTQGFVRGAQGDGVYVREDWKQVAHEVKPA
jgi:GntR family transcriptional regulator